jgi:acyl carrier protein
MTIEERVVCIVSELVGVNRAEIRPTDDLRCDLGLDSIRAMELLAMLDDELGIDATVDEAAGLCTVADVVDLVRARCADAA